MENLPSWRARKDQENKPVTNVVDTLDSMLALYAPMVARWMKENPSFEGIDVAIANGMRDDPIACPKSRDGAWLDAPAFEAEAAAELAGFAVKSRAIADACPIAQGSLDPLSLSCWRHGDAVVIYAKVSPRGGGLRAERNAIARENGLLELTKAELILSTEVAGDDQAAALTVAAGQGAKEVVRHMIGGGMIRHMGQEQGKQAATWLAAFPEPAGVEVVDRWGLMHEVVIKSNQEPVKVIVPRTRMEARPELEAFLRERNIAFETFDDTPVAAPDAPSPK